MKYFLLMEEILSQFNLTFHQVWERREGNCFLLFGMRIKKHVFFLIISPPITQMEQEPKMRDRGFPTKKKKCTYVGSKNVFFRTIFEGSRFFYEQRVLKKRHTKTSKRSQKKTGQEKLSSLHPFSPKKG